MPKAWRPKVLEEHFSDLYRICGAAAQYQAERILSKELKLSAWFNKVYSCDAERIAAVLLQLGLEYGALGEFLLLGDELGFPVGDTDFYPSALEYLTSNNLYLDNLSWPSYSCRREAGLAQHHGVPTRLLDWTRKPEIAAYFAVANACGEKIAVWCANLPALDSTYTPDSDGTVGKGVRVLTCPRYNHTFLHAQDALFTLIDDADRFYLNQSYWPSLEAYLQVNGEFEAPPLRQITLCRGEVDTLVRLLLRERISKAHLMPTFDNISETLRSKWRLQAAQYEQALSAPDDYIAE